MQLRPPDFVDHVAFEERWTIEDHARAKALIAAIEKRGIAELRFIPPDGLAAHAPGRTPLLSPVEPEIAKPILSGLESLLAILRET